MELFRSHTGKVSATQTARSNNKLFFHLYSRKNKDHRPLSDEKSRPYILNLG